jgi:outer membrane protein TolC
LQSVALSIDQADAAVANARASLLPRLNLGFGYSEGRKKEVDFGPYSLAPWETSGGFSWEIDVSGKLRAAKRSAQKNRDAAVWDYQAARLLLASRVAASRFNLYRFNQELSHVNESLAASSKTTDVLVERSGAGLIADSMLNKQRAEHDRQIRQKLDLERLRDLSIVQLRTLRGGTAPAETSRKGFPVVNSADSYTLDKALRFHPEILAAEARVRAAFQLEKATRLNLLPSFKIGAFASGRTPSLGNRYRSWITKVGPSLDIPIYDPARLASVKARKAEKESAAANYRKTTLKVLEEFDSARINLRQRTAQLAAVQREIKELESARNFAREQYDAGITSQIEFLDTERRWLEAKRSGATLRQAQLNANLNLIKATGGVAL